MSIMMIETKTAYKIMLSKNKTWRKSAMYFASSCLAIYSSVFAFASLELRLNPWQPVMYKVCKTNEKIQYGTSSQIKQKRDNLIF